MKQILEAIMELQDDWKESFISEAKMMARLRHPNIVQLLGVCVQPYAVITEFMANGTLNKLLKYVYLFGIEVTFVEILHNLFQHHSSLEWLLMQLVEWLIFMEDK